MYLHKHRRPVKKKQFNERVNPKAHPKEKSDRGRAQLTAKKSSYSHTLFFSSYVLMSIFLDLRLIASCIFAWVRVLPLNFHHASG